MKNLGEYRMQFGGQERVFKFGNNTVRLLADHYNIQEIDRSYFKLIPALLWAGLKVREAVNDLPEDFSVEHVCDWMDEAGEEACAALWLEAEKCMGFISRMAAITSKLKQERQ
ncbi:hypothetical protein CLV24_11411 [Pontibacter ummariensis]|uniref:Uncharacterized protein n=1 Tax=Pontibacter ummariensis TaxID=1610492 RepID=A0A239HIW4_9BACT|nr:hypothetical protein [Pontibacter ummariensis]PRY10283.1 hypothetical protein CLV24_11411 [Pontibacter ummariensis]SNS81366.1 hypothetical protein SAMN06296052_11411 [Pontibacter ummariensis]